MKTKRIAICSVRVLLVVSLAAVSFSVLFGAAFGGMGSEKEQFENLREDYEAAVRYLITDVMQKYPEEDYICLGLDSDQFVYAEDGTRHKEKLIVYIVTDAAEDNVYLKPDKKIMQSFSRIQSSFMKMGYSLTAIRIRDGKISFDVIDGRYSLCYELSKSEREKRAEQQLLQDR